MRAGWNVASGSRTSQFMKSDLVIEITLDLSAYFEERIWADLEKGSTSVLSRVAYLEFSKD